MKKTLCFLLLLAVEAFGQSSTDELVNVKDLIPDIAVDLKYNTADNFLHQKLYSTDECLLAMNAAQALRRVQDSLRARGIGLKVFDGYRPRAVQFLMWEILPNPIYVADPRTGSNHNRGAAVDVTLIDLASGQEFQMPTPFDWFGPEAAHDYMNLPPNVIANRALLRDMMEQVGGFMRLNSEWWHYDYPPARPLPLVDFQLK